MFLCVRPTKGRQSVQSLPCISDQACQNELGQAPAHCSPESDQLFRQQMDQRSMKTVKAVLSNFQNIKFIVIERQIKAANVDN